jgi:hypothetical protein
MQPATKPRIVVPKFPSVQPEEDTIESNQELIVEVLQAHAEQINELTDAVKSLQQMLNKRKPEADPDVSTDEEEDQEPKNVETTKSKAHYQVVKATWEDNTVVKYAVVQNVFAGVFINNAALYRALKKSKVGTTKIKIRQENCRLPIAYHVLDAEGLAAFANFCAKNFKKTFPENRLAQCGDLAKELV